MFNRSKRPQVIGNNPLNTPIVIHKNTDNIQHLNDQEMLTFLSDFINTREQITIDTNTTSVGATTNNNNNYFTSSLSHLKRIERDFKGLPPTILEGSNIDEDVDQKIVEGENEDATTTKSATGAGKKLKFSD
ncbi:uncharacterized protein SCODWIG_00770 [Saccharomycodes ludwigii]|uniref:DNA-directed RNA polymerase I subunit RPA14 n=1 Tax=Saccharomycodes ludwigii TaxID=36035 RepID=A0A376B337_9ASCO|nr:hypothetical protein SCDLUD_001780 [Saccharomycodes ludwigii]KAH3901992.1 hypothetical protein SCDLUD_001780 [Saccharomycodes ludwigii]SSD59009.1 uncharacterized protein SCODWIG_00770 [Saccharomycodes ludwigii]